MWNNYVDSNYMSCAVMLRANYTGLFRYTGYFALITGTGMGAMEAVIADVVQVYEAVQKGIGDYAQEGTVVFLHT